MVVASLSVNQVLLRIIMVMIHNAVLVKVVACHAVELVIIVRAVIQPTVIIFHMLPACFVMGHSFLMD